MGWARKAGSEKLPAHNHDYNNGFDRKSADCPRCILNAEKTGVAIHTCEHGGAFGRRDMSCIRCQQLAKGVNVETETAYRIRRARKDDANRSRDIHEHYANGECARTCGRVCVKFDW